MLETKDISQIEERGSNIETVKGQIKCFIDGFPFLELRAAATIGNGLIALSKNEVEKFVEKFDNKIKDGVKPLKFVPASGAASRMFKSLFAAKEKLEAGIDINEVKKDKDIAQFFNQLGDFAFYKDLVELSGKNEKELSELEILNLVLGSKGLDYGNKPKGLLKFHTYSDSSRTPIEEHLVEGANYAFNQDKKVFMHFTVSPEHQSGFEELLKNVQEKYEQELQVKYDISFSQQKPATDTIAVDLENNPFRENDGSILFRPAGHGALLENLNDLDADIIFIKNIDNVVPDQIKQVTFDYKKALAGVLINLQEKIFYYQEKLNIHHYYGLNSAFFAEAANFLENVLNTKPPQNLYYSEKEDLYQYLKSKFNRPIRVCGMVKNEGEPGGGPFWAVNGDGSVSLQVAESSQINMDIEEQKTIVSNATHFNPVDLVCAIKNYKGEKYNLLDFRDPETGFISTKSKDGKELKAQELPGLWNGAMSNWNTLFIEVPIATFNPVKTVNDLLRKEHQSD